ncbi:SMR family transporter [Fischerella sp. JS2]|uniref:SMR family transporter n=1 Tax=Fischerella sp. JS2 TaxID=2597771 RepID=UPI0028EB6517|nr:SMR family transporter [Fischerella sp. JS2]
MLSQIFFILLILLTVALNTVAQTFLKLGAGQNPLNIYLFGGTCLYFFSMIVYITVLGKFNLSIAYPIVIGLTVVATTIVGSMILQEKVSPAQWIGVGLLISGIWAIAVGKTL